MLARGRELSRGEVGNQGASDSAGKIVKSGARQGVIQRSNARAVGDSIDKQDEINIVAVHPGLVGSCHLDIDDEEMPR
ncbi:hypothetical protein EVG20_g1719 [Dentipellis fragilis]|uniref:Uncharacterized protein n=1 Tax=Dentipellis fragilis TaxID=205917 RepID=A0A4Y9Z9X8_9AGAM|nr:hypothetical protein EVG20_g1719 [Dentipellis fragilis]